MREAGIQQPILVLEGAFGMDDMRLAQAHGLWLVVHQQEQLRMLESLRAGARVNAWLKIDTGMHRAGLEPGEVFVHRNIANVVVPTDLNCLSTIQYAVDQLHIEHLMVVGHYGCGGVLAALQDIRVGLADNWIRHVKDVRDRHRELISATEPAQRHDVLCELNVIEQVMNVAQTTVIQDAWAREQRVQLHGWCYGLKDGLIHNLHISLNGNQGMESLYRAAVEGVIAARR